MWVSLFLEITLEAQAKGHTEDFVSVTDRSPYQRIETEC